MYSQERINQYINKIIEHYAPEKIIMFGSYAYGNPDDDSDVDLLVIKETTQPVLERNMEVNRLLKGSLIDFDVLVRTKKELSQESPYAPHFVRDVLTKGKVLYTNGK